MSQPAAAAPADHSGIEPFLEAHERMLRGEKGMRAMLQRMNLAGIDPYMQRIALGAVILLAVLADQLNKRRGQSFA